jgi:hypothetical protein
MATFDELGYTPEQLDEIDFVLPLQSSINNHLIHRNDDTGEYWLNPVGNINFIGGNSENLQNYQVIMGDNWPLIAHKIYGSAKLWWVLAELNNVLDAFTELPEPGETIKIITPQLMWQVLNDVKNNAPDKDSRLT